MDVKEKIKNFPDSSGVYLMKDARGSILYVGKASSLKKRLSSYFQKPPTGKIQALLSRTKEIEYIQTSSSAQALLLESALIKQEQPYYNAELKDDKSYPYLKISTQEDYPSLVIQRGEKEKYAHYYGPYTNAKLLKGALKTLRTIFPFRSCAHLPKNPCLYFNLGLCPGMCVEKVDKKGYQENLRQLRLFLEGRHQQLLDELKEMMHQAAKNQCYEEAARLRDKIVSLGETVAQTKKHKWEDLILELQKTLDLPRLPYRIEAFDISQIAGIGLSGAMVSFLGGWPDKTHYRKFKIKTVSGINDYAMICELLRRRYSRENSNLPRPDLIMIDGGKGHLSCAQAQLRNLGLGELPVIALAKRLETVYTSSGKVLNLSQHSKLLHLLQRIRDEAHRFAIAYHRKLSQRLMCASLLDEISGIGPRRKRALLHHFKSVEEIQKLNVGALLKVEGIDKKTAKTIVEYFKH